MTVQHSAITDPNIHEPKGAASATDGTVYVSNGAGSGTWTNPEPKGIPSSTAGQAYVSDGTGSGSWKYIPQSGFWDYNDYATSVSPIALTVSVYSDMTNDGAGAFTLKTYAVPDIGEIWNTSTNRFDFSNLELGDTVDLRIDISVTTSGANHAIETDIDLAIGSGSDYTVELDYRNFKNAGTYNIVRYVSFYIGNNATKDYPAKLKIKSDGAGDTVTVNGWYIRVIKRGS